LKNKLLVINLQNPSKTHYHNKKDIGMWMWGKRISNYKMFVLDEENNLVEIKLESSNIFEIQKKVNEAMKNKP